MIIKEYLPKKKKKKKNKQAIADVKIIACIAFFLKISQFSTQNDNFRSIR